MLIPTRDKPKERVADESENISGGQHCEEEIRKAGTIEKREYFALLLLMRASRLNINKVIIIAESKEKESRLRAFDLNI